MPNFPKWGHNLVLAPKRKDPYRRVCYSCGSTVPFNTTRCALCFDDPDPGVFQYHDVLLNDSWPWTAK